ncbi:hypothetical protein HY772_08225 [Candidatus Woesearchaeota archaeon]|nr:hypothetical protein [Candidatus Woesearchaeota archaeon]
MIVKSSRPPQVAHTPLKVIGAMLLSMLNHEKFKWRSSGEGGTFYNRFVIFAKFFPIYSLCTALGQLLQKKA